MRIIGIILIVLGAVVTAYALSGKTLTYQTEKPVVDTSILKLNAKEEHTVPTPLWAGVGGLAVGVVLVFIGKK